MSEYKNSKKEIRAIIKSKIMNIPFRTLREAEIILKLSTFLKGKLKVLIYRADKFEVSLDKLPFLYPEKKFYYPKIISTTEKTMEFVLPNSWGMGAYGIQEPIGTEKLSPGEADLIVVPALSFNEKGFRLGRGGGFYDRALSEIPISKTLGLTFGELFPLDFKEEEFDVKIGTILSETGVIFSI